MADQLDVFMAALRKLESGIWGGNYTARNGVSGAYGAYQIMPSNWEPWAREAGIPGANPRDPWAQDTVARYKLTQYFNRWKDWRLVAIAWFAGGSRADRAAAEGINSVGAIKDSMGTSVATYVDTIVRNMAEYGSKVGVDYTKLALGGTRQTLQLVSADPQKALDEWLGRQRESITPTVDPKTQMRDNLAKMLSSMSNAVAGGRRMMVGARTAPQVDENVVTNEDEEII